MMKDTSTADYGGTSTNACFMYEQLYRSRVPGSAVKGKLGCTMVVRGGIDDDYYNITTVTLLNSHVVIQSNSQSIKKLSRRTPTMTTDLPSKLTTHGSLHLEGKYGFALVEADPLQQG